LGLETRSNSNNHIAVVTSNCTALKLYSVIYFSTYSNSNSLSTPHSIIWKVICAESILVWPLPYSIIPKSMVWENLQWHWSHKFLQFSSSCCYSAGTQHK